MRNFKLYLDNCCYNRPYDDQTQLRIELETKAKLFIQQLVLDGKVDLIWSYILEYENDKNRVMARRNEIAKWRSKASISVTYCAEIENIAEQISNTGVKTLDALHVACSIYKGCDYFISTDDRLLRLKDERVNIINPFEFIRIYGGGTFD